MAGKMVQCPLGVQCSTTGKKHRANSAILQEHTAQAKKMSEARARRSGTRPRSVAQPADSDAVERFEEFVEEAGVDYQFDKRTGQMVMSRSDGRSFAMTTGAVRYFFGLESGDEGYAARLLSQLDEYSSKDMADTVSEATEFAAAKYDIDAGRMADFLATGKGAFRAGEFMPKNTDEFLDVYSESKSEAERLGAPDKVDMLLGRRLLDKAEVERGVKITGYGLNGDKNRTSASFRSGDGMDFAMTTVSYDGSGQGKRTPEEIVGRAVSDRVSMLSHHTLDTYASENEAVRWAISRSDDGDSDGYYAAVNDSVMRSRQIEGLHNLANEFLGPAKRGRRI
jgi:hypothetical protein